MNSKLFQLKRIALELLEDFDTNNDSKITLDEFVHHRASRLEDGDDAEVSFCNTIIGPRIYITIARTLKSNQSCVSDIVCFAHCVLCSVLFLH